MNLGKLFGREPDPATQEIREDGRVRLPGGQYLTKKWPSSQLRRYAQI